MNTQRTRTQSRSLHTNSDTTLRSGHPFRDLLDIQVGLISRHLLNPTEQRFEGSLR